MKSQQVVVPSTSVQLYQLFYVIEVGLRELIIANLSESIGPQWMTQALPGGEIQEKVRNAKRYEKQCAWVTFVPHHPIYYLDFPELITILERRDNWERSFKSVLGRKDIVIATLRALEPLRNKVAHNRLATLGDVAQASSALEMLNDALSHNANGTNLSSYASSSTVAVALCDQFVELEAELRSAVTAIRASAKPIPLERWKSIKSQWWFDDTFLGTDLSHVRLAFGQCLEYSGLPRNRGEGHKLEAWTNDKFSFANAETAIRVLTMLSNANAHA